MRAYGKILRKVLVGFIVLYLVMMFIFTYSKQVDVRREYENHIFDVLHSLEEEVRNTYTKSNVENAKKTEVTEEVNKNQETQGEEVVSTISWYAPATINEILTREIKYDYDFNMYGAAAVFKEGDIVGKSGNYLICSAVDWNLNPKEGGSKYIDLEAYLSDKQLIKLLGKIRAIKEDSNKIIWIRADGYSKGNEVIPTTIEILEIERSKDGIGWYDQDAKIVETYQFEQEKMEGLETYYSDNWDIESPIDLERYTTGDGKQQYDYMVHKKMTQATFERIKSLEERLYQWKEEGFEWQRKWNEVTYAIYSPVETETGQYTLALTLQYQPWFVALRDLKFVYLFSGLAGIVMSLILTGGLWKTEKKQLLLEKNRRALVDAIGHELKTPLGIIGSYSEGLKEKIAEDKKDHYLDVIIDETQRMNELILEMLQLSKLESDAYCLRLEQFSLNDLIKTNLKNKQKLFEDKEIVLKTKLDEEIELVADYLGMEKVFNNLLMNAIEHTPIGGTIEVRIEDQKVSVQNEGQVIPEEKLNQIWESFYKVEEINNRSGERTGLGLAIVKQILEKHGMTYGVKNMEKGVAFWFKVNK